LTAEQGKAGDAEEVQALLRLRLDGYYRNLPPVLAGNAAAGLILSVALWEAAGPLRVLPFVFMLGALTVLRTVQVLGWRAAREREVPPEGLRLRAFIGAGISGATWTYAVLALFVPGAVEHQALLLMVVGILGTAGAATLSPYLPAYYLSLVPCMPVAGLRAVLEGGQFGTAAGAALVLLTLVTIQLARMLGEAHLSSYRLRLRNEALVAQLRRQAEELERTVSEAQVAARAKSEFLATVSHEIRTPANAILGGIEILGATPLDERQSQCVGVIAKAGQSLVSLLDDILDITRVDAGHLTLQSIDFDLHQRLRDVVELMTPRAAEKGLVIALAIGPGVPPNVRGDPARLRQILLNLIGNAVKFTAAGGVTVTAAADGEMEDGHVRVRLSVVDTGIGIPPDRQATIFDAFEQADGSIGRRFGGAGLGLAICRRLVTAMDGTIGVSSAPGKGSIFTIELPLLPVAAPAPVQDEDTAPLPIWTRRPTVLLVEDEAINRFVATNLLERHGLRILSANTGHEALDIVGMAPIEAVLMDLGLPEMDGFETTRRIRALPGPESRLPIIALTANVMPETMARCMEAGMQGFASKPIRLDVLLRKLAEYVPPDGVGGPAVSAAAARLETLRRDLGDEVAETMRARARAAIAEGREALSLAWRRRARRRVGEIAHKLAGTLDVVGLTEAAEEGRRLERATEQRGLIDIGPAVECFDRALAVSLERLARAAETAEAGE